MRQIWVKVNHSLSNKNKMDFIRKVSRFSTVYLVAPEDLTTARGGGAAVIASASEDADILVVESLKDLVKAKRRDKTTCFLASIGSKNDEKTIISASEASADYVAVKFLDWKVIPLENLIAQIHGKSKLLVSVSTVEEIKLVLETLEIGADGILVDSSEPEIVEDIHEAAKAIKTRKTEIDSADKIKLKPAQIVKVKPLGSGARVCIDTCDLMREGEGLLVGCQSSGLFLVEAEVRETPFVNPRPFRINAGSIALYVLGPLGKTRYLSELKTGDEVLIVDREGKSRITNICRVKIEWRPLLLIEAKCMNKHFKTILQNAETVRLVMEKGAKSMNDISASDKVLVILQEGGRHFGTLVKEEKVVEI